MTNINSLVTMTNINSLVTMTTDYYTDEEDQYEDDFEKGKNVAMAT